MDREQQRKRVARIAGALICIAAAAAQAQTELPPITTPETTPPATTLPPITTPTTTPPANTTPASAPPPSATPANTTPANTTPASTTSANTSSATAPTPSAAPAANSPAATAPTSTTATALPATSASEPPPSSSASTPAPAAAASAAVALPPTTASTPIFEAPAISPIPAEQVERSLEFQLRAGVSVATIQVDGNAQTAFLPGALVAFRQGMLFAGILFDTDPGIDNGGPNGTESRSGWHFGAMLGPSFELTNTVRLDLAGEVGLHELSDSSAPGSASYATSATLPYFGVRPALSVQFGSGKFTGAVGAALFFRIDAGQRQPDGLPDDGGHQLGAEAFLSLRIALL